MAKRRRRRKTKGSVPFRERILVNLSLKIFVGLIVIICFLTISQCTVKSPEAPTWTSQWTVPLINRSYQMPELIERIDETALALDSAGNPHFSIQEDVDSIGVDASMTAPDVNYQVVEKLGAVSIPREDIAPLTVNFADVIPFPPGAIPPIAFDFAYDGPSLSDFSSITVGSGSLHCEVFNNLGIPLDTVKVDVYDLNTFQFIGSSELSTILLPGATDTITIPVAGKTITNRLRMQVHVHSPGGVVLSTSGLSIVSDMSLSDPFTVIAGSARIPAIDKNLTQTVALGASDLIYDATLSSGSLDLILRSSTSLTADLTITLPDFTLAGVPLSVNRTLAGAGFSAVNVDLAGYQFAPSDSSAPQEIEIQVIGHIDSSGGAFATFNGDDSLQADASLTGLAFSTVRGVFDSVATTFAPVVQSIAVPNGFDSAQFTAAVLTLEIDNGSELAGSLNVTLDGSNGKTLSLSGSVDPGAAGAPITTSIIENNMSDFLNPIPSSITVSGDVIFGDGVSIVDVTANDFVKARVKIESPLEVLFNGSTLELDPETSAIDTAEYAIITDHLIQAELNATISNHLPAGMEFYILVSADSTTLYSAPDLSIGPITVSPGQIDGSGVTIAETVSNAVIALDSADVQVFKNPTVFIGQTLTIPSSGAQPIRFLGADYFTVDATVMVEYKFNGEF